MIIKPCMADSIGKYVLATGWTARPNRSITGNLDQSEPFVAPTHIWTEHGWRWQAIGAVEFDSTESATAYLEMHRQEMEASPRP